MDRVPMLSGGCQCGAIRYALYAVPRAGICYCRMCQKAVGGPFFAWASVPATECAFTRGAPSLFRSSSAARRGFCAACGTPLTFQYDARPGEIDISIGSLDTPDAVPPTVAVGTESRLSWCNGALLDALPSRSVEPPPDLARIVVHQHPDADTPEDWLHTRRTT